MDATLPRLIRITREGDAFAMTVDGIPFPHLIADEDITVALRTRTVPTVQLTLMADRIEVINDLAEETTHEMTEDRA